MGNCEALNMYEITSLYKNNETVALDFNDVKIVSFSYWVKEQKRSWWFLSSNEVLTTHYFAVFAFISVLVLLSLVIWPLRGQNVGLGIARRQYISMSSPDYTNGNFCVERKQQEREQVEEVIFFPGSNLNGGGVSYQQVDL